MTSQHGQASAQAGRGAIVRRGAVIVAIGLVGTVIAAAIALQTLVPDSSNADSQRSAQSDRPANGAAAEGASEVDGEVVLAGLPDAVNLGVPRSGPGNGSSWPGGGHPFADADSEEAYLARFRSIPDHRLRMPEPEPETSDLPAWRAHAIDFIVDPDRAMIAIVMDDLGIDEGRSRRSLDIEAPLTAAYLPYANNLNEQVAEALEKGHELLIHLPMEPFSETVDPGPDALYADMSETEILDALGINLGRFEHGAVGLNNHMGSRFTSSREAMEPVIEALRREEMVFLDSVTAGETVAYQIAREMGVPALRRDVFLDHDDSPAAVAAALRQLESVADRRGYAIAIGHPKDVTIDALNAWVDDVQNRGFQIVPLSAVMRHVLESRRQLAGETPVPDRF